MTTKNFNINKMRIASPCPAGWENMKGNDRKRFCSLCSLDVYNISEMTTEEVRALVANSEGRICARIYKRADGSVMTRDCPVGVRAYRKQISNFAGAIFTAVIGLYSAVFGQENSKKDKKTDTLKTPKIVRTVSQTKLSSLNATITDPNGAVIPGVTITLESQDHKTILKTTTSDEGKFTISSIPSGIFSLEMISSGFKVNKIENLIIKENEVIQFDTTIEMTGEVLTGVVGIIVEEPMISTTAEPLVTKVTKRVLDKLPY